MFGSYLQTNGYKPSPLDLSTVTLSEKLEELVELLAENTHNVWARDRIKNGWTYGLFEVGTMPQCVCVCAFLSTVLPQPNAKELSPLDKPLAAFSFPKQRRIIVL